MFLVTSAEVHGRRAQWSRGPWSAQRERGVRNDKPIWRRGECSADQSAARREERCVAGGRGAGWMEGWGEGDDSCLGDAGREMGRRELGCAVENKELDLAPKSLDLELHLPCENT